MAHHTQQSQFRRFLSLGVFVALGFTASFASAQEEQEADNTSYTRPIGREFFLLSEKSFASDERASVRFETQGRASSEEDGLDVVIYRVPEPLAFLRTQKNLHRIKVVSNPKEEGLSNMLKAAWDKTWVNARLAWIRLFSSAARRTVTQAADALKTPEDLTARTPFQNAPAYPLLPGLEVADRFRYPIAEAKPITPPKGVALAGSSSEFLTPNDGNIRIPLGVRAPGLYVVEAYWGEHRAVTLMFVSDHVLVTKNASDDMMAYTAHRKTGAPAGDSQIIWTDGVGVLKSGKTASDGVVFLSAKSPESSYVYGEDAKGGVFISENFYHDSEIYNAKLYAVTDRPLYRPGDLVQVKFLGREFKNARTSVPVPSGKMELSVEDPTGSSLITQTVSFDAKKGGETSFRLPAGAEAGGWELTFKKGEDVYGAAFRVANYVKPHFEVDVTPSKTTFKTKEEVKGRIKLTYPDGKPVANSVVRMMARAQNLTMIEGALQYGGQIPVAIKSDELTTDSKGVAEFVLPASEVPARYVLSLLAQDQAAYRVRYSKEILIEQGANLWKIAAPLQFSKPGEPILFSFAPQEEGKKEAQKVPVRFEKIRLEDRKKEEGTLQKDAKTVRIPFEEAGSYTVSLRDTDGNLLASASHWVAGAGLKVAPGTIEIVFDKETYQAGDTAQALISFSDDVFSALLTLERDKVEAHALLGEGAKKADWVALSKLNDKQWQAEIQVKENFGPNITFSVLAIKDGDYVFQNKGLKVTVPALEVAVKPSRSQYAPGDEVTLDIETRFEGKTVPALVNMGVVDEMIYVLQPELAPSVSQFFYHPRRNNVRTSVSLSFIAYDLARLPNKGASPNRRAPSERGVKVLERPRRDDTDTAAWWPSIMTNANGKATVRFKMPDALTRWRITARGMTENGAVGQRIAHIASHKNLYVKWSGPATFREGDKPTVAVIAFNQTNAATQTQFEMKGEGVAIQKSMSLNPGANTLLFPLEKVSSGDLAISLKEENGKTQDQLTQAIRVIPQAFPSWRSHMQTITEASTPFKLPDDAKDIRVSFAESASAEFARIAEDLYDYPWGCVEQTASRLLPLSLMYRASSANAPQMKEISQSLATQRLRLIQLAGPEAMFGWWGRGTAESSWLTAYAYYADWHASRALNIKLPADHWRQVLKAYEKHSDKDSFALRVLSVWFMNEMGLPIKTLTEGLLKSSEVIVLNAGKRSQAGSLLLDVAPSESVLSLVLLSELARAANLTLSEAEQAKVAAAKEALKLSTHPMDQALLAMVAKTASQEAARASLASLSRQAATLDRALALVWWHKALGGTVAGPSLKAKLTGAWRSVDTAIGKTLWSFKGEKMPEALTLTEAPVAPLVAHLAYRSATPEKATLPHEIKRTYYRLVAKATTQVAPENPLAGDSTTFTLEAVKDGKLRTNELYLEEVSITPKGNTNASFGLLEIPLPPGADVERGTWGVHIKEDAGIVAMNAARFESGNLSYAVPVERLSEPQVFRHLIRFGMRGIYTLPPARYTRMYQMSDKAFEGGSQTLRVE